MSFFAALAAAQATDLTEIKGRTIASVRVLDVDGERTGLEFTMADGDVFVMDHMQDCCETVTLEDISGDLEDLVGNPLLEAEEVSFSDETPEGFDAPEYAESYTWTFYKLGTIKGCVTLRWLGESNGYYSEDVWLRKVSPPKAAPPWQPLPPVVRPGMDFTGRSGNYRSFFGKA